MGGEVTAAFPELTWSQPGDLATGFQLFSYVKGWGRGGGGRQSQAGHFEGCLADLGAYPPH